MMKHVMQNTKQQIQAKKKLDAVQNHVRENKPAYITGAVCLVGAFLGTSFARKTTVTVESSPTINVHIYPERNEDQ